MSAHGEMGVLVAALLLCGVALSAADAGLSGKALVFPKRTNYSYVTLTPQKPLKLTAFTLCMNVATELEKAKKPKILFAYRTDSDELNIWQQPTGYSLCLRECVYFCLPPLTGFKTHFCVTWESTTGLTAMWFDGKRSIRKTLKEGHTIICGGTVILGQVTDSTIGSFDVGQSFVGEISDLNMWDYVLPESQIEEFYSCYAHDPKGNIFDWETIKYQINGSVLVASAGSYT